MLHADSLLRHRGREEIPPEFTINELFYRKQNFLNFLRCSITYPKSFKKIHWTISVKKNSQISPLFRRITGESPLKVQSNGARRVELGCVGVRSDCTNKVTEFGYRDWAPPTQNLYYLYFWDSVKSSSNSRRISLGQWFSKLCKIILNRLFATTLVFVLIS